jgi:hypothetical protein
MEQEQNIYLLEDKELLEIFNNNYSKVSTDLWNGEKVIEELFDRGYELDL